MIFKKHILMAFNIFSKVEEELICIKYKLFLNDETEKYKSENRDKWKIILFGNKAIIITENGYFEENVKSSNFKITVDCKYKKSIPKHLKISGAKFYDLETIKKYKIDEGFYYKGFCYQSVETFDIIY